MLLLQPLQRRPKYRVVDNPPTPRSTQGRRAASPVHRRSRSNSKRCRSLRLNDRGPGCRSNQCLRAAASRSSPRPTAHRSPPEFVLDNQHRARGPPGPGLASPQVPAFFRPYAILSPIPARATPPSPSILLTWTPRVPPSGPSIRIWLHAVALTRRPRFPTIGFAGANRPSWWASRASIVRIRTPACAPYPPISQVERTACWLWPCPASSSTASGDRPPARRLSAPPGALKARALDGRGVQINPGDPDSTWPPSRRRRRVTDPSDRAAGSGRGENAADRTRPEPGASHDHPRLRRSFVRSDPFTAGSGRSPTHLESNSGHSWRSTAWRE